MSEYLININLDIILYVTVSPSIYYHLVTFVPTGKPVVGYHW